VAAGFAVYGLSVGVVDVFQSRVGTVELEELEKQAQVALSVLWAVLGAGAFAIGLRSRRLGLRQGGLLLLALATAKVFLVDLNALDVAYRVLSFIALGLLLLGSAYLFGRMRPPPPGGEAEPVGAMPDDAGPPEPDGPPPIGPNVLDPGP
jgi:uncharacterized membrane protein